MVQPVPPNPFLSNPSADVEQSRNHATIRAAMEAIDRFIRVVSEYEARRQNDRIDNVGGRRFCFFYFTTGVTAIAAAVYSMVGPLSISMNLHSLLREPYLSAIFEYFDSHRVESWAQWIMRAAATDDFTITPDSFYRTLWLTCKAAGGFETIFPFEVIAPLEISRGIPWGSFGFAAFGVFLGAVGNYLMERTSWREIPLSFREFHSLYFMRDELIEFAPGPESNISQSAVSSAIQQIERVRSSQIKAYVHNCAYSISWVAIGLALWGLYLAGTLRADSLTEYDLTNFNRNVQISYKCPRNSSLEMYSEIGMDLFPVVGGAEYLRNLPPAYVSRESQEYYRDMLTIPGLTFAVFPFFVSFCLNMVVKIQNHFR